MTGPLSQGDDGGMNGYWEQLQKLVASGKPFVAVTLVDVVASAPANAGAKMLVAAEGLCFGSVGGGKIEMKAIAEAKALLVTPGTLQTWVGVVLRAVICSAPEIALAVQVPAGLYDPATVLGAVAAGVTPASKP